MKFRVMFISVFVVGLFMMGCNATNTTVSNPKISFEIREFEQKFQESDGHKSYSGKATIVPVGEPELVKKPYLIFIKCEKTKGGDEGQDRKDIRIIEIVDGIGKFDTYDGTNKKDGKFEKPQYKFDIIGYLPLIPLSNDSLKNSKINFELKGFETTYEETQFSMNTFQKGYSSEGTIIATGDPTLVKKPYIILVHLEKTGGGRGDNVKAYSLELIQHVQYLTVIDGICKINAEEFLLVPAKESVKGKIKKPEYKIEIIGYRQIEV